MLLSYSKFLSENAIPKNRSKIDPNINEHIKCKIIEFQRDLYNDICFNFKLSDNNIKQEELDKLEKLFSEIAETYSLIASRNLDI